MHRCIFILLLINLCCYSSFAQTKKTLQTTRVKEQISIDGELDEKAWHNTGIASDFIVFVPNYGQAASEKTEVRILYDDDAIYVGAEIFFTHRDSVFDNLAERDKAEETDWFAVIFDPYKSGLNGFTFQVSASGVQTDVFSDGENEDYEWNAVWNSEVVIKDSSWVAEMRIPYSALRFPKKDIQSWGVNFGRLIYAKREISFWNDTDPNGPSIINYNGILEGIENIQAPLRLSISPYISAYVENGPDFLTGEKTTNTRFAGGADLRYGINEAFTLDMTLVPDFGQVRFDEQIYNLSPFEIQFNENRQFFKEGRDLFDKGEIFYSRRIGGPPRFTENINNEIQEGEVLVSNPGVSQVVNATKVSGRTKTGLGLGVFNGITRNMYAIVEDSLGNRRNILIDPTTNYNVLAFDQYLKNNSSVSFVNTNVMRDGHFYDANTSVLAFDLFSKEQRYNTYGNATISQQFDTTNILGHRIEYGIAKSSGRLKYSLEYFEMSDDFDINDLGFQTNNNERTLRADIDYRSYTPKKNTLSRWGGLAFAYSRLYNPDAFTNLLIGGSLGATWKNFLTTAVWGDVYPSGDVDYFEPRVPGRYFKRPAGQNINLIISSNFNKPIALELYSFTEKRNKEGWFNYYTKLTQRYRIGERWMIIYDLAYANSYNDEGIALGQTIAFDGDNPIFGRRDIRTVENRLNLRHFFTNRMTLSFIGRHFWTNVNYKDYFGLGLNGELYDLKYDGKDAEGNSLHNTNFNAFTIDMVFSWVFAPGSIMTLVWKNSIFDQNNQTEINYFQNTSDLFNLSATNSFSLKVLYYLDYASVKSFLSSN